DREALAREQLRALVARRAEQAHAVDARDVSAPFLQAGRALVRIALAREQLPVRDDRLVRRPVELDRAALQEDRPIAEPLDRSRIVRDEDDRAAALFEVEDLAEALALERLV